MSKPRWFRDSEGRFHVAYELKLTNGFPVPVRVTAVSVRDVARRRTIERLSGPELTASMSLMASPNDPGDDRPGLRRGVVWFDIVASASPSPAIAQAHVLRAAAPAAGSSRDHRHRWVRPRGPPPAQVLGPPLRGPGWVAVGSCCDGPHRRALQPVNGELHPGQRFAIDWNGVDAQNRFLVGDPAVNTSWTFYGKPVIAVADGPGRGRGRPLPRSDPEPP